MVAPHIICYESIFPAGKRPQEFNACFEVPEEYNLTPGVISAVYRFQITLCQFENYLFPCVRLIRAFGDEHVMWVYRLESFLLLPGKKNSKVANRNCWAPTPDNPLLFRCSISPSNPIAGSYQFYLEKINNETTGPMTLFKQTLSLKPGEAFQ